MQNNRLVLYGIILSLVGSFGFPVLHLGAAFLGSKLGQPTPRSTSIYLKARAAYLQRDLPTTINLLGSNSELLRHEPAAALLLGKSYFFQENFRQAEESWKSSLSQFPHHQATQKWLARLYLMEDRAEEAETICVSALSNDSEDPELLLFLGKARLLRGSTRDGLEYLEKAKVSLQKLAEIPLELSDLYRQLGLKEKSVAELELALALLGKESSLYRTVKQALEGGEGK